MLFTVTFCITLVICIGTVLALIVKGFQELIEPIKMERELRKQKEQ